MIVSINPTPKEEEFQHLINNTISALNTAVTQNSSGIKTLLGQKFEPYIGDLMKELAVGTPFENSIEIIGGQKFPDIVAKKYYGVEVKTTSKDHWRTTGNSVSEGTRIDGVERIYLFFAKLKSPIEFRCRPYQEVLSEIVVTHSPRYLVDMNLEEGATIFDKIKIPYDELRTKENPIKPIVDYYRSKLKQGEELWWMDSNDGNKASNIIIRVWNNLPKAERELLEIQAMAYFPELFGNSTEKFGKISVWLIIENTVVCPNIRDLFSAGGRGTYDVNGKYYQAIPRVFLKLFDNINTVRQIILETPATELSKYWAIKTTEKTKFANWIKLVSDYGSKMSSTKHLNIEEILITLIRQ